MSAGRVTRLVGVGIALLGYHLVAAAEEKQLTDDEVVVRTEGAHRLLLPKDWPVEEQDGRLAPVSVDAYLGMKFNQVAAAFDRVTQRLDALDHRLQQLEDTQKTVLLRLRLLENAPREPTHQEQEGR